MRTERREFVGREELHIRLFKTAALWITDEWNALNVKSPFWRFYRNDNDGASIQIIGKTIYLRATSFTLFRQAFNSVAETLLSCIIFTSISTFWDCPAL